MSFIQGNFYYKKLFMIPLNEFKITETNKEENSSVFVISPLPTGYGHTLGNILKRILSSSVPGAAVTAVKINGAQHEYSTLAGVSDDILTILLSLKNVVFLMKTEDPVTLKLSTEGSSKGVTEVKAKDIQKNADVEIVNEDYVITRITDKKTKLDMEIKVERGVGYRFPDENVRMEVGLLPIDAIFSPVKLVQLEVTPTRVGQQTDLDQLNLFVQTNGSLTPSDALNIASNILGDMSKNFITETQDMISGKIITTIPTDSSGLEFEEIPQIETKPILILDLKLSTRLTNSLLRAGFDDLRKLEGFTEEEVANIKGDGREIFR